MGNRARNPRRVVLEMISEAHKTAQFMVWRWKFVPGEDIYRNAEGRMGMWGHRNRRDIPREEYIEYKPEYWAELYNQMNELEQQARKIKAFAREQYVQQGGSITAAIPEGTAVR